MEESEEEARASVIEGQHTKSNDVSAAPGTLTNKQISIMDGVASRDTRALLKAAFTCWPNIAPKRVLSLVTLESHPARLYNHMVIAFEDEGEAVLDKGSFEIAARVCDHEMELD